MSKVYDMQKTLFIFSFFIVFVLSSQSTIGQENKSHDQVITEFISKKKDFNEKFGYGFRIQLYNGFEVEAKKIQARFKIDFPEIKSYIVYRQPEWKIQVGTYKTKLEADRALLEIKRKFSGAIVVPLGK